MHYVGQCLAREIKTFLNVLTGGIISLHYKIFFKTFFAKIYSKKLRSKNSPGDESTRSRALPTFYGYIFRQNIFSSQRVENIDDYRSG